MIEEHLEALTLEWLSKLGYQCFTGDEVSLGGEYEARKKYSQVILRSRLEEAVERLNPALPASSRTAAVELLTGYSSQSLVDGNREIYGWLRGGVPVEVIEKDGHRSVQLARVIDYESPEHNDLLAVSQFTVHGQKNHRPDIVLFINGLPVVVIELKNPADPYADIESAFNQIKTYQQNIPRLFDCNLLNVISDGVNACYGSVTAGFDHYGFWRLLNGNEATENMMELEVLTKGLLNPNILLNILRHFVLFSISDGSPSVKIVAKWHQYRGVIKAVERAVDCYQNRKDGKGGVLWFTQGSGKSYLALFYAMMLRENPAFKIPTIIAVTDRNDLDEQLFETFSSCSGLLKTTPRKAESRADLKKMLSENEVGGIFFTTINKFAPSSNEAEPAALCDRDNVIVIVDEAHRTQYGFTAQTDLKTGKQKYGLAKYMRDCLPNAIYLGMTGTPVSLDDRDTEAVFGTYVDIYEMTSAEKDKAIVPILYESRVIDLSFNEEDEEAIRKEFEECADREDAEGSNRTVNALTRLETIAMSDGRLDKLANDLMGHWGNRRAVQPLGKAMVVAICREAAVRLYDALVALGGDGWDDDDLNKGKVKVVMTATASDPAHFQKHRTTKKERETLKKRLRDPDDELEIVIVRDMWLTGFDSPTLNTMYVDKPMKGHGLMQAITRVNRVWRDKPGGLIVDYIGLGEELKAAIKTYTRSSGQKKRPPIDVSGEALKLLLDTVDVLRTTFFAGFNYSGFLEPKKALQLLGPAMNHLIEQERKKTEELGRDDHNWTVKAYQDTVTKAGRAQALAGTQPEALELREEIGFFQAIATSFRKYTAVGNRTSRSHREQALRQLVAKSVIVNGVTDLFSTLGLDKPNIGLLDEEFLQQVREMPEQNLAAELLQRLLNDSIKARGRKNAMQEAHFTEKMKQAIQRYSMRGLTTVQVIEEMIALAKELNASKPPDDMTDEEWAFYQALTANESATRELGHPVLRSLAVKLTDQIRRSTTIDWQQRGDARARMRVMIKHLLKMYKYPPDKEEEAIQKVVDQAERLTDDWAFEQP